ncbi:MAG: CD225/dispanin family protein [Proteiniphilum sp.]|nr:CD225/dispanin family protein [Proteiniphilum sp.]
MEDQFNEKVRSISEMPPIPVPTPGEQEEMPPLKPSNWLWQSIVATALCCLPFGIVGIIYAVKVDSLYFTGRYDEAERVAGKARLWTLLAFGAGLLYLIIWSILFATGLLPDAMEQIIESNASGYNF